MSGEDGARRAGGQVRVSAEEPRRPLRRRIAGERARTDRSTAVERTAAPAEPATTEQTTATPRAPVWVAGLVVLTLLAVGVAGWVAWQSFGSGATSDDPATVSPLQRAEQAVGPASAAAAELLSVRYADLEAEMSGEVDLLTDDYADEFVNGTFPDNPRANATIEQLAEADTVVTATVREAAAMDCGEACAKDTVQVLVFFDSVTTSREAQEDSAPNRAVLTMRLVDDTWLVDDIETP